MSPARPFVFPFCGLTAFISITFTWANMHAKLYQIYFAFSRKIPTNNSSFQLNPLPMRLSKHFRFCLWWESVFKGGPFSTCKTRKNGPLWHFFYTWDTFFYGQGVIFLRRKMTPRSIFDGGRYSSLHPALYQFVYWAKCKSYQYWLKTRNKCEYIRLIYSYILVKIFCTTLSYFVYLKIPIFVYSRKKTRKSSKFKRLLTALSITLYSVKHR